MQLRQGTTLQGGKYRIIRVLGQGGFGITYLAEHTTLYKKVAVKEFFPKTFCGRNDTTSQVCVATEANGPIVTRLRQKFIKEAQNLAKMDCPYIVRVTDVFEQNDTAYYVMDYIEGQTLAEMVKLTGPMRAGQAIGVIEKIGEALEYIHSKRMNHLDVKPANVMVRASDLRPILIDFGLSKQYDTSGQQTSTTPVGISHGYAPIEQYSDGGVREFSPQTDVYALGATLYYLLSGKTPEQAPVLISNGLQCPPEIPGSLRGPITKAMSPSRDHRYPTVAAFLSAIGVNKSDGSDTTRVIRPAEVSTVYVEPQETDLSSDIDTPSDKKKKSGRRVLVYTLSAVAIVVLVVVFYNSFLNTVVNGLITNETRYEPTDTIIFPSVIGECKYSGELDDNYEPHGRGTAVFAPGGVAISYEGEWIHGNMSGQAVYIMSNGDVFKGIFRENKFSSGRYSTSGGEYYEGTFVDEQPYMGAWYDKSGRMVSKVIKGKES